MGAHLTGATLLVCIDFSDCCERALLRAVALAEQHRAQLELVHVFEWQGPQLAPDGDELGSLDSGMSASLWKAVTAQAHAMMQRLAQLCSSMVADRAPAGIRVLIGEPAPTLLQAVEQLGAARIILGAHGRRMLPSGMVGRTAECVSATSPVPVLLIPATELARKHAGPLFLSAAGRALWICARCSTVQPPHALTEECTYCGDLTMSQVAPPTQTFDALYNRPA